MPNHLPSCPDCNCACYLDNSKYVCPQEERAVRAWKAGILPPMDQQQREWCLVEIEKTEGYNRKDCENLDSPSLANMVLSSWVDYCRDKWLL